MLNLIVKNNIFCYSNQTLKNIRRNYSKFNSEATNWDSVDFPRNRLALKGGKIYFFQQVGGTQYRVHIYFLCGEILWLVILYLYWINQKTFLKTDFDSLSKNNNTPIQKIILENLNDNKILKEQIINQVYAYPEKRIILAHNIEFTENFLIYIDKIIDVSINENSNDYEKYFKLSKIAMTNGIFNTYDNYIKKKYEIDINYKALAIVKNYFNWWI